MGINWLTYNGVLRRLTNLTAIFTQSAKLSRATTQIMELPKIQRARYSTHNSPPNEKWTRKWRWFGEWAKWSRCISINNPFGYSNCNYRVCCVCVSVRIQNWILYADCEKLYSCKLFMTTIHQTSQLKCTNTQTAEEKKLANLCNLIWQLNWFRNLNACTANEMEMKMNVTPSKVPIAQHKST